MDTPTRRQRQGQMIPIVGFILLVFAFVAFGYMAQSQSTTSITGIAIYGMQAHQLGLAVADEVALGLEAMYDEGNSAPWKMDLVNALDGAADGADIVLEPDVASLLADSPGLIGDVGNADLVEVKLRLHGFHRLHYHGSDTFDAPESFYFNEMLDSDESFREPPRDWVGYATVQVKVEVRGIQRQVQITRDLKLVDVQPPGREFAFFNWMGLLNTQADLAQYSLNRGGDMAIWPQEVGRVVLRGPYVVLQEGQEDCTGGKRRSGKQQFNYSWPDDDDRWRGWSVLPPRRGLPWSQVAAPGGDMIRSDKLGSHGEFGKTRWPTKDFFSAIPPFSLADATSAEYTCGVTPIGTQTFSIMGRPGREVDGLAPADTLSMFRGLRVNLEAGEPTGPYDTGNSFGGGSDGDGIMPEGGGLISLVNHAVHKNNFGIYQCLGIDFSTSPFPTPCFDTYSVYIPTFRPCVPGTCTGIHSFSTAANPPLDPQTFAGGVSGSYKVGPWAIQYSEKEPLDLFMDLIGAAIGFAMSYTAEGTTDIVSEGATGFTDNIAGVVKTTAWGSVMTNIRNQMVEGMLRSQLTNTTLDEAGSLSPRASEIAAAMPEGLFPPKFRRHYMRGATRIHLDLDDALSLDGTTMNLDGIVMVERFPEEKRSFLYTGKGILFTQTDGEINKNPHLGDIKPATPEEDWMTFAHVVQRDPQPDGGDAQVQLTSNELEMTLYAEEGVTTESEATLLGNYLTMIPNKHQLPQGTTFDVWYNTTRLAPESLGGPPESEWTDGTWKRVNVSPKVSGYFDRFQ